MKRNRIIKRIATGALTIIIAASMTGCGAGKTTESGMDGSEENKNVSSETEASPEGRYVETEVTLPLEDGESVLDLIQTQDGTLELYSGKSEGEGNADKAYRYDGSGWDEEAQFAAQGLPEGSTLLYSAYGKGGTLFVIYADGDYKSHLVKFEDGMPIEELSAGIEDLTDSVNGLYAMDNGTVILPIGDQIHVIDASAREENTLPQKDSYSNFCDSHTLTATSFVTAGDHGFIRYNTKNWSEEETIPFQNDETDISGSLAAGAGDDFYLANSKGIHHMAAQGTMWETVVDGSLNSMGMPSVYVKRLFVGNDNDFYLWYSENEVSKLVHYTYDPQMSSVPSTTLTVYGLDLSDNLSVKQAASLFQMENPDVKVEVTDESGGAGATSKTDTIRALNAELLNGNGADVLVLDGLPADSYIGKGILDDLSDMITPMVESGELYPNIAESFTDANGSIFQYPVRVLLPVIYGEDTAVKGTVDLETLNRWQQKNSDKAVFSKTSYENMLRQLIYLYYPELMSGADGQFDKDKIQLLLETAKMAGDASGCQVKFDVSEEGDLADLYNTAEADGFIGLSRYGMLKGDTVASVEEIKGMEDTMLPYATAEKYGYPLKQFNDIYYPKGLLCVVKASKEKETARKFVELALSLKIQESDLRDGFPVSKNSDGAWLKRTSNIRVGEGYADTDTTIYADYPDEQKKTEIMGMLDNLRTPVIIDDILLEMLVSETKGYFDETQTAVEAAAQFENKAKLYYAE